MGLAPRNAGQSNVPYAEYVLARVPEKEYAEGMHRSTGTPVTFLEVEAVEYPEKSCGLCAGHRQDLSDAALRMAIKQPQQRQSPSEAKGKLTLILLFALSLTGVMQAQFSTIEPPEAGNAGGERVALTSRLSGSTWNWTSLGNGFNSTVTFEGTVLKFQWGGSGKLGPAENQNVLQLTTNDGATLMVIFDAFLTGFRVMQGSQTVAIGKRPMESPTDSTTTPRATSLQGNTPPASEGSAKTIKLKAGWDTPMQGGSRTHKDLAIVLNGFASASSDVAFDGDIELFNGVKYLMPFEEAVKVLGISQRLPSAKKVVCPGLPRDTLNYISFEGLFDGAFNRMDIVTDLANQVVTLQIVNENPKEASRSSDVKGELTYNFIGYRVKAMTYMKVKYLPEVYVKTFNHWGKVENYGSILKRENPQLLRVESHLVDKEYKLKESVRWFVPKPFAALVLYCIQKSQ